MRGLVAFLALTIAALGVLGVVAIQVFLPGLVSAAVRGSAAFAGANVDVQVRTSLDGVLVHGWIDEVVIAGDGLHEPSVSVDHIRATVTDVGIVDRRFASLSGVLTGVSMTTLAGNVVRFDSAVLSGSSASLTLVGHVAPSILEATLASELGPLGITPAQVRLIDGAVRIELHGATVVASLRLDGSTLVLDGPPEVPTLELLPAPADGSWRLAQVVVSPAGAEVTAIVDPASLGLGG